jgi:acyl carrier protein
MDGSSPNRAQHDQIGSIVADLLIKKGLAPTTSDASLRDAGLSSLDMVNLMLAVEDAFDLVLPQEAMTPENFRSVDAIRALVASLA